MLEKDPVAVDVRFSGQYLTVGLDDGRSLLVPLTWYPRLLNASKTERQNWLVLGNGYAIEWPDLDEHIGIEGLLAGHPSGESADSLKRWLASRTKKKRKKAAPAKQNDQPRKTKAKRCGA